MLLTAAAVSANLQLVRRLENFFQTKGILEGRKENIAGGLALYQRQEELRTSWQERRVKLGSADDKDLATIAWFGDFLQIMNDPHSRKRDGWKPPNFPDLAEACRETHKSFVPSKQHGRESLV